MYVIRNIRTGQELTVSPTAIRSGRYDRRSWETVGFLPVAPDRRSLRPSCLTPVRPDFDGLGKV
jgi:hypothetical protein